MFFHKNAYSARYLQKIVFWGLKSPLKKKQGADIVGFLVCFFRLQSTPLSTIRPLPARFALFFPYLPTPIINFTIQFSVSSENKLFHEIKII